MSKSYAGTCLAIIVITAALVAVFCPGCAPKAAPLPTAPAKVATAAAEARTEHAAVTTEHAAARADLGTVAKAPELPPALLPPIKSADQHVANAEDHNQKADKALSDAIAANAETSKQIAALAKERDDLAAKVKDYDGSLLGGKGRFYEHLIIAALTFVGLLLVVYGIYTATHPGVTGVGRWLLRIGTGGLQWVWDMLVGLVLHSHATAQAAIAPKPATA